MPPRRLRLVLLSICIAFTALPLHASFRIVAPAGVFEPGAKIELAREDLEQRTQPVVASQIAATDGSLDFAFDGEPGLYRIKVEGYEELPIAPNRAQTLRLDRKTDKTLGVSGSPDTEILHRYETLRKASLARLVYPVRADIKAAKASGANQDEIERLTQKEVDSYKAHLRELNDFTLEEVGTSMALYATSLRWDGDYRSDNLAKRVDSFAAEHPDLLVTQRMRERVDSARRVAIGSEAPPLAGKNLEGDSLRLADFRGRYALVDFWASWCPPCRLENRHYRELAEMVDADNFTFFSVNMDTSESQWKRAAKQDGISWPDVSDLQGLKSTMAAAYLVSALPKSFLIDPAGKIVAKDLRGAALNAKLAELGLLK